MPSRDLPCASCGTLMWRSRGSLPEGRARCQPCRRHDRAGRTCPECAAPVDGRGAKYCSRACANRARPRAGVGVDADLQRARWRRKNHTRRAARHSIGDVTPDVELKLRGEARACPLCEVRLIDEPYQPASKELDHIVPLGVGGTHTVGNVRIICRQCNLERPKDGSDFVGQVTLWAQDLDVAQTLRSDRAARRRAPCCPCGRRLPSDRRCRSCTPLRVTRDRRQDGRIAAILRAQGRTWSDIAMRLDFATTSAAAGAARRHGHPAVLARWPLRACSDCGSELPPPAGRGRPATRCPTCRTTGKLGVGHPDPAHCHDFLWGRFPR